MYPQKFEDLIHALRHFPGVGEKTAERYAFTILEWDDETIQSIIDAFAAVKGGLKHCKVCGNLSEEDECLICKDQSRNHNVICVVQSPKDVIAMEKMNEYNGVYHVLNGVINTSKGIMPQDLNIESLIERVNENTEEVIIATNPTVDGETTALYLSKLLETKKVNVTRIAHGLPMGGHLDYADELTLIKAFEGRKKM
ncbi:recombination mediator RecR [Merdibacter massiliensis]|uniref:recombination mediator RecR n=1 Tax=Merdibacter massiliensis TaxID=1871030 RepID=UPI00096A6AF5|nr:recombination mediator RecR [Merdibacter massiliensis]